jgi:four helix bundle protein
MKDFRDLTVWNESHKLTPEIYRASAIFPKYELYGLTSQIHRCSASLGANIAEGCGKRGNNEFQRYLQIAAGSASELDYHLLLSRDLGCLPDCEYMGLFKSLTSVRKMLTWLLHKVETDRLNAKC